MGSKHIGTSGNPSDKNVPLLNALEGWLLENQKTLSLHPELTKTFALNRSEVLKYDASVDWAEPDNNTGEKALKAVSLGRIYHLFFGSDLGIERGA